MGKVSSYNISRVLSVEQDFPPFRVIFYPQESFFIGKEDALRYAKCRVYRVKLPYRKRLQGLFFNDRLLVTSRNVPDNTQIDTFFYIMYI